MALTKVTYSMIEGALINVLDFGADPTGATNSLPAIQAAIDSGKPYDQFATDGIMVFLPPGIYRVDGSVDLTGCHGVNLVGAGRKATELRGTTNAPVVLITGSDPSPTVCCGVRDMTIRGADNSFLNAHGIDCAWANSASFRDLFIFSCRYGMKFTHVWQNAVENIRMTGLTADACYMGVYMAETGEPGLPIDNAINANNINVQNCLYTGFRIINGQGSKFVNCEAGGAPMIHGWHFGEPTTGTFQCQWVHLTNCLGDSTSAAAWLFRKGNATELSEIQLSNCWSGNGEDGYYLDGCRNMVFNSCQSIGHTRSGFVLSSCEQIIINGCTMRLNYEQGSGTYGDILLNSSTYNTISSNNCYTSLLTNSLIEINNSNYNNIYGNYLSTGATITGPRTIVHHNIGFLTETAAQATIAAANTEVTVTHDLAVTPPLAAISVTPNTALGAATQFYIDSVTATTFKIKVNTAPGVDIGFCWNISNPTFWI